MHFVSVNCAATDIEAISGEAIKVLAARASDELSGQYTFGQDGLGIALSGYHCMPTLIERTLQTVCEKRSSSTQRARKKTRVKVTVTGRTFPVGGRIQ
jgi:hypothetical protein